MHTTLRRPHFSGIFIAMWCCVVVVIHGANFCPMPQGSSSFPFLNSPFPCLRPINTGKIHNEMTWLRLLMIIYHKNVQVMLLGLSKNDVASMSGTPKRHCIWMIGHFWYKYHNEMLRLLVSFYLFWAYCLLCPQDAKGNDVDLSTYKGKVLLIVNVASKW